jgi:hypothetical protein
MIIRPSTFSGVADMTVSAGADPGSSFDFFTCPPGRSAASRPNIHSNRLTQKHAMALLLNDQ